MWLDTFLLKETACLQQLEHVRQAKTEEERKRKERQIAVASDGYMAHKDMGRGKEKNRQRKRVRREEAARGAEGENNMTESLRSRGDWGIEGGNVIATQGKKESSQLCLCVLDNEYCVSHANTATFSPVCVHVYHKHCLKGHCRRVLGQYKYEELSMSQEEKSEVGCPSFKQHKRKRLCKQKNPEY